MRENASAIPPTSFSSDLLTLKEIGYADDNDALIKDYIDAHHDEPKSFWQRTGLDSINYIHPDLEKAFKEKANEFRDERTFEDVMKKIIPERSRGDEDMEFLDSYSEDDYCQKFKEIKGKDSLSLIRKLLSFREIINADENINADEKMKSIAGKAEKALQEIGKESPINRLRLKNWFNISVPD